MSTQARDLIELREELPNSLELRRIAAAIIASAVRDERSGL